MLTPCAQDGAGHAPGGVELAPAACDGGRALYPSVSLLLGGVYQAGPVFCEPAGKLSVRCAFVTDVFGQPICFWYMASNEVS